MAEELLAVSSGEYSDYEVWAVFDDGERANQYRDQLALVEYNVKIKTLPLNPGPPEIVRGIAVWMDRHGDTEHICPVRHCRISTLGFRAYRYASYEKPGDEVLRWRVHTEDPKHAVKVVNEVRAQLIAIDAWGDSNKTRDWMKTRAQQEGEVMIIHYTENEQDVAGWGLCLKRPCGGSDTRAYIGCTSPEDAISLFLEESGTYSRDDILAVTPILDYRLPQVPDQT